MSNTINTKRQHFHSFDALRFFAFLFVFFHHLPYSDYSFIYLLQKSGGIGVSFFFVLSGFLISYILLHQKTTKGKIVLKNFFARRVLRIWPLFYAMILFAFVSQYILEALQLPSSNSGYAPNWWFSIFFAENYKMMLSNSFPNGAPLRVMWSLCIEEHFYILWGLVFYFLPIKKIPYFIVFSIVLAHCTRFVYTYFAIDTLDIFSNLDYFAYGAIPAYCLLFYRKIITMVGNISYFVKYGILLFTALLLIFLPHYSSSILVQNISPIVLGSLFACIVFFIISPKPIHIKDSLWISKLGIYTYGLYLYHTIVILLLLQVAKVFSFEWNWFGLAILAFILTAFISIASYHLFEKQFLKLKKYFA